MSFAVLTVLFSILLTSCHTQEVLPRDGWNEKVYHSLDSLIRTCGNLSPEYDAHNRPYAVFDFDNTTIVNDISMSLMIYQIENLRFGFTPERAFDCFTAFLPDLDKVLDGPQMTARELGTRLAHDYAVIYALSAESEPFEQCPEYLDFRASLMALNDGVENSFDYATWCLWQPSLFSGMTYGELQDLTRESVAYWTSQGRVWTEIWKSPDGRLQSSVMKGLIVPKESIHLYNALRDNGFDVYICSASLEVIVETMACDEKYSLGMEPDDVFGIRLADKTMVGGAFEEGYDQTFLDGKSACIRKLIAPRHGGKAPALVAGDSNGDYDMLTSFDSLGLGLIIDCGRSGPISTLSSGRYVRQERFK